MMKHFADTKKRTPKDVIEKMTERGEESAHSSEFDDVFDVNYTIPSRRSRRTGVMIVPGDLQAFFPRS